MNLVVGLSREVLEPRFPGVRRRRPFYRKQVDLDTYWSDMETWLSAGPSAIFLSLESWDWSHWTVVSEVQKHRLILQDSSGRKFTYKRHCSVEEVTEDSPIYLHPPGTLVFIRD